MASLFMTQISKELTCADGIVRGTAITLVSRPSTCDSSSMRTSRKRSLSSCQEDKEQEMVDTQALLQGALADFSEACDRAYELAYSAA